MGLTREVCLCKGERMSQKNSYRSKKHHQLSARKQRIAVVMILVLILITTGGILAQRPMSLVTATRYKSTTQPTVAAPVSLTPTTPSKEYIYAGGKLLATEQPMFTDVPLGYP